MTYLNYDYNILKTHNYNTDGMGFGHLYVSIWSDVLANKCEIK